MDRAEEISRGLVGARGLERIRTLAVRSSTKSTNKFLPNHSESFYKYIRRRVETFTDDVSYVFNGAQSFQKQIYYGMVMSAQNAYFLLGVQPDFSTELVRLDLSELSEYTVYSGEVIKISGINPTGEEIVVDSIICDKSLEILIKPEENKSFSVTVINANKLIRDEVLKNEEKENTTAVETQEALNRVKNSTSDLVIIFGDIPLEERVLYKEAVQNRGNTVVFIPGVDGLEAPMTFPTEYIEKVLELPVPAITENKKQHELYNVSGNKILELQNPTMLSVNGISFALSSIDVLRGVSRNEVSRNRKDRMFNLLAHSVYQGTFLPFVPHDIPVDYSVYNGFIWTYTPDIYIFPTCLSARTEKVCHTHIVPVNKPEITIQINCDEAGCVSIEEL